MDAPAEINVLAEQLHRHVLTLAERPDRQGARATAGPRSTSVHSSEKLAVPRTMCRFTRRASLASTC